MKKKRILVPHLEDYYLMDYLLELSKTLQLAGYEVTVLTADKVVYDKFYNTKVQVDYMPSVIRLLRRRSGNVIVRCLLWLSGYLWILSIKNRYDFAIVPWDNKPLWYLILKQFPSLTVHNTTNLMDLNFEIESYKSPRTHKVAEILERVLRIELLPRLANVVLKHNKFWYIDKLFGMRSKNLVQGFSGIDYMTVTGNKIKNTLIEAGLSKIGTKIIPTGNPTYDGFLSYAKDFNNTKKEAFKKSLGLSGQSDLYGMFLSPSFFSKAQIKEVTLVVEAVLEFDSRASISIKFHPKTESRFIDIFDNVLSQRTSNYKIISGSTGDRVNLDIILSSKCILQKQSTVGFIAMMTSVPIISYNLLDTDYYDDMYKYMEASWHCETAKEIMQSLSSLNDGAELQKLSNLQEIACSNFCLKNDSASNSIVGIINNHFTNNKASSV